MPFPDAVIASQLPGALRIGIRMEGAAVAEIDFLPADTPLKAPSSAAARHAADVVTHYFNAPKEVPDIALATRGTCFQERVWAALRTIPAGSTVSYGDLAIALKSGARAVAGACRANPIPLLVPCHRVIGRASLGGFMGAGAGDPLVIKEWLLRHEGAL